MLTLGVAALVWLALSDALRHLPTPHRHYHTDKASARSGYNLFDSFHKRNGDAFGFEKQSVLGDDGRGQDGRGQDGAYHRTSSYHSGNRKPKLVSYHYESKLGTPRDYSKYDPETYEGDYSASAPSATPYFGVGFSKPLMGESCPSLGRDEGKSTGKRGRKFGTTMDSQSVEEDESEFGFHDDGDMDGSFEGEFFSEEAAGSFETDDSAENEASFY